MHITCNLFYLNLFTLWFLLLLFIYYFTIFVENFNIWNVYKTTYFLIIFLTIFKCGKKYLCNDRENNYLLSKHSLSIATFFSICTLASCVTFTISKSDIMKHADVQMLETLWHMLAIDNYSLQYISKENNHLKNFNKKII